MSTPGKQPRSSIMTYEEEEEMQHDIEKLRDQVQQVSLAQKGVEAKMEDRIEDRHERFEDRHGRIKEVTTRKGH